MKICVKCSIEKESTEFVVDKRTSDGRTRWCKSCKNRFRDHRRAIADNRNWRKLNPEGVMLQRAQQRAKNGGYLCTITKEDIVIPPFCAILGIPLIKARGTHLKNSPSLDRKNSTLGYVREIFR